MARGRAPGKRVLQTVLFTDMVKSTERLTAVGDASWRALVQRHNATVRTHIRQYRGREVDTAGDGFLITFDQPIDAVHCAVAVVRAVQSLGMDIRAGIHTGEVERIGPKVGGIAVHTAARIMAAAEPGEVLVSSTVQDLVAGSGTEFVDHGQHELRGVPGERRLFAVVLPAAGAVAAGSTESAAVPDGWSGRRLAVAVAAAVGALILVVGGVAALLVLGGRATDLPSGENTVLALDRSTGKQTGGAYVGRGPGAMALAGNTLWIANVEGATVSRVDVSSGNEQAIGNVGSRPGAIAADDGSVWVADAFLDRVVEVEPATGVAVGQVTGVHGSDLAIAFGSLWLADDVGDRVVRVDPSTRTPVAEIAMPPASAPTVLAADAERLWVGLRRLGEIVSIDPETDQLAGVPIPFADVAALAGTNDALWAISPGDDALARIDPATMRVAQRATVCDNPVALSVADDGVWVACSLGRRLWHVGLDGQLRREVVLDGLPTALAIAGDRVWVTLRGE